MQSVLDVGSVLMQPFDPAATPAGGRDEAQNSNPAANTNVDALAAAVEFARRLVGGRRASLMLPANESDELRIAAASGLPESVAAEARVRLGDQVSGLVAQTQQPMLVNEDSTQTSRPGGYQTGSFISVPVPLGGETWGVLNVADPETGSAFHPDDLTTLQEFANYIAHTLAFMPARQQVLQLRKIVRQLQWQIIQAQENERQRIARDLHDEGSHALTAAIFRLDMAKMKLSPRASEAHAALNMTREALVECAGTLHNIAFALRPRILEDLGLERALRSLVKQAMELGNVEIALTIEGEQPPLDEPIELAIFRVVQEALTNTRKYAGATEASVRLTFQARRLTIVVEDNGVGIAAQQSGNGAAARQRPGLGLAGMRERVEALGGTLTIGARDSGGTRIVARLPLRPGGDRRDR